MRKKIVATAAAGVVAGGVLFNSPGAKAILGIGDTVFDPTLYGLTELGHQLLERVVTKMQDMLVDSITSLGGLLDDKLTAGFTQTANYLKAQIGAQQQIADASNTVNARFQRDLRNAAIRDEHVANPEFCVAADAGQTPIVASVSSFAVASSIATVSDRRGEALPGTPAHFGTAQAVQANNRLHYGRYCSETEAQAGLCAQTALPNADQHASNLFGTGTYADQDAVNAANDYRTTLIQPVVPAALRADQLASLSGQDALPRRRSYNARMSLANGVVGYSIAVQTPSVPLTEQQQRQLVAQGLPPQTTGSWLTVLRLEANRRMADPAWHANLQRMPPASVMREIAVQLALGNYMKSQEYQLNLYRAALDATKVAQTEEQNYRDAVQMPSPDMAAN